MEKGRKKVRRIWLKNRLMGFVALLYFVGPLEPIQGQLAPAIQLLSGAMVLGSAIRL